MVQNEFYRLDLVVGATGDVQVKEKLNSMDRFIEQTRKRGEALNRLQMSPAVRLQDKLSTPLRSIEGKLKSLGSMGVTVAIRARDMTRGVLRGLASPLGLLGMGAVAAGPALFATSSVGKAMDFEAQMSSVQALADLSKKETEMMSSLALKMGAKTKYNALEAAQGIEELVKAGISPAAVKAGALEAALNLATAGGLNLAEAATTMSTALNAYKQDNMTAAQASNILAGTANASAADVSDLRLALSMTSAVASMAGMTFKDTNIALGVMANSGMRGSDAGTSLKTMLMNLIPQTQKEAKLMKGLGIITKDGGNQFFTAAGKMKPLREIAEVLKKSFQGMTQEQRLSSMQMAFGTDAVRAAAILYKKGAAGVDDFAKAMSNVTALDVAKKKMDNAAGAVEQFRGAVETLQIAGLMPMMPLIKNFALWAAEMAEKYTPAIVKATKSMAEKIGKYFDGLFSDKTFAKMGFGDKMFKVLNMGIDSMGRWIDGPGGAKVQRMFASLAVAAGRGWLGIVKGLIKGSVQAMTHMEEILSPDSYIRSSIESTKWKKPTYIRPSIQSVAPPMNVSSVAQRVRATSEASTEGAKYIRPAIESTALQIDPKRIWKPNFAHAAVGLILADLMTQGLLHKVPLAIGKKVLGIGKPKATENVTEIASAYHKVPGATLGKPSKYIQRLESKFATPSSISPDATGVSYRIVNPNRIPDLTTRAGRAAARARTAAITASKETEALTTSVVAATTKMGIRFGVIAKAIGKLALPVAAALSVSEIAMAKPAERTKTIGGVAGGWGGAIAGAKLGGFAGAGIGSFFGPAGTAVGGASGAALGGIAGIFAGGKLGEWIAGLSGVEEAIQGLIRWVDEIPRSVGKAIGSATRWFEGIGSTINYVWTHASDILPTTLATWGDWGKRIYESFILPWSDLVPAINEALAGAGKIIYDFTERIKSAWGNFLAGFHEGREVPSLLVPRSGGKIAVQPHARGGIFTQPHVGLFAEAGPEALIPLAPAQRARAWSIWQETGERLGIRPYALGGFTDARPAMSAVRDRVAVHKIFKQSNLELTREGLAERLLQPIYSPGQSRDNEAGGYTSPLPAGRPTSSTTTIHINMGEAVRTIQVNNQGDIAGAVDTVAEIVARKLTKVIANMA